MFTRAWFILKYWLYLIIFFEAARLLFLFANFKEMEAAGLATSFASLLYGVRMDMSMAAYLVLPVALLVMGSLFIKALRHATIYKVYNGIILLLLLLLLFADIGLYKAWGTRLDDTVLKYLSNPKEAWASIYHLPVFTILIVFVLMYFVLLLGSNKLLNRMVSYLQYNNSKWLSLFLVLLLTGLFIIPLRGGLQLAPLNQSSVYFSQNNFANMAAINAPWNFMHALSHHTNDKVNPFQLDEKQKAAIIVDSLFTSTGRTESLVDLQKTPKPNVIIIAWESLTSKAIGLQREGVNITPGFDSLIKEGIYFSNIYASGDRTDKGIVAILSGYPSQPTTSIVKIPAKAAKLPMLSKFFRDTGYTTSYHYGGELEFANMKAYLIQGAFQQFVSVNDFAEKDKNSKWGAHDGVVMKRVIEDLAKAKQPFFSTWLTISSHEPYEIPTEPVLKGKDDVSQFLSSLHYTDAIVYNFIQQCKKQSWWSNTIVVIVADHGHRLLSTRQKSDDFRIPLLFMGGALRKTGITNSSVGSQTDLAATLLAQLGYRTKSFVWSKNLLDSSVKQWGYFSFNNGFGYIEPGKKLVFDNIGNRIIEQQGAVSEEQIKRGRFIQQLTYQDFLDK